VRADAAPAPSLDPNLGREPFAIRLTPRGGERIVCRRRHPSPRSWDHDRMKLTRLRLLGFKSFVEPTDFLIEPGLTGVVGPTCCGKSNLVEALRRVMGETAHKAMRAADMDD